MDDRLQGTIVVVELLCRTVEDVRAEPSRVELQWLFFAMGCDDFGCRPGCFGVEVCIRV